MRPAAARPRSRLKALGYGGAVRVSGGPWADRLTNAAETYLGMSVDDILHGFRVQAGLPAPGKPMTGWSTVTTQSTFGQWVSGLARLGSTLGEVSLTRRAVELVDGLASTLGPGGDPRMRMYSFEKLVCGLTDTAIFAHHDAALDTLAKVVDWGARVLDKTRRLGSAASFQGGTRDAREWYTLPENFYRAWLAGADDSVRDFAAEWHYDSYWDRFLQPPEPGMPWDVPVWLHAYSHLNTFASAAAVYEVTGEPRYLDILRNAHRYFTTTQTYATGGYGPGELTLPEDGTLGRSVEWRTDSAEIVCGSWAAFKLCSALLRHTGEARYGDWVETLAYSGIGAVTPVQPSGQSPYYQDYRLGIATKLPHWDDWPCCSGTYLQTVAHLPDLIYFAADDGIAVNLYIPSTVHTDINGTPISLAQQTAFPTEDTSTITVESAGTFTVRLRIPGWAPTMTVAINHTPADITCTPGTWAEISRDWHPGDTITITFGARLRILPIDQQHPNRVAFAHGPVVLAQTAEWTSPISLQTPWPMVDLDTAFTRETPLIYRPTGSGTARLPQGTLKPLAEYPDRSPYRIYFDLNNPRII